MSDALQRRLQIRGRKEIMNCNKLIAFVFSILLSECNNTVGTIELKGKVIDENTKTAIPNISVMIEALDQSNDKTTTIYAGDFTTDSSGCFAYTLEKVKNISLYNFFIEGNPAYDPSNQLLGLSDLNSNGKFLTFEINRIVDFTMNINRKSQTAYRDTLIVSWETNGVDGKTLYPFKIENYRINSENGLFWTGGDVKSKIETKVYADKNTIVHWELFRNGRHTDIIDTIFCKRNTANSVFLNY
ncbi:MAG: hypothetical protein WC780_13715 [Lentimicrobiaceae bacterium]